MKIFNVDMGNISEVNSLVKSMPSIVRYHSKNCGHCLAMKDDWKKVESEVKDKSTNMILISIEPEILDKFEGHNSIMGYPTILKLSLGEKEKEYEGDRTTEDILKFIDENSLQNGGKRRKRKSTLKKSAKRRTKKKTNRRKKRSRKSIKKIY
jgi:hypothetical protein